MVESVFNITVFSQKNDQIKGSPERSQASWWFQPSWKIVRQNENLPKVGLKIKNLFETTTQIKASLFHLFLFRSTRLPRNQLLTSRIHRSQEACSIAKAATYSYHRDQGGGSKKKCIKKIFSHKAARNAAIPQGSGSQKNR